MSKKFNRLFALSLAVVMSAAVFAGCGKSESKNEPVASSAKQAQTQEEKKPTLKVLGIWQNVDYNTYPVAKVLEEKTGYKVEYEMLPQDKPEDKLNLLVASSEPYDVVTINAGDLKFKALYNNYAKQGALTEVTTLIDKYGSNIKSCISTDTFNATKIDGKQFAIPTKAGENATISLFVRTDWLEKLNMKVPTTLDEFVSMLKAFKEKDPGGNGAKNVPLTVAGTASIPNLLGAFGIPNSYNEVNGKIVPMVVDPAFKDYLAFVTDLYKQGLVDKEFPTNKAATVKEKFSSGTAGVIAINWADIPAVMDALVKNKPDAKAAYLPLLKGKDGKMGIAKTGGLDRISFIPKASKNPEHAMKWINAKLDKDVFKLMTIGEEGKHHTYKDGAYSPVLPAFNDERGNAMNYLSGLDEKNYPVYWQARVRKDLRLFEGWEYLNVKQPAEARKMEVLLFATDLPEYAKNNAQLGTMINDFGIKVVVGAEPISGLDAMVQKWKTGGGDAVTKEINDWYAAYKK